jgi:DNA-3-methyladenine glycosylase II
MPLTLNQDTLESATAELAGSNPNLAQVVAQHGSPPLWARDPGFPTLVQIILEQQVSLASARAAFDRLRSEADPLTPARLLQFNDSELKSIGFSRQKAGYARGLAQAVLEGQLDVEGLAEMDDDGVTEALLRLKGIGPWSAQIYLLMALRRPDVWPAGDRALAVAVQRVLGLPATPRPDEMEAIGAVWRPWRAVAARIFWHYYLSSARASGL